ncbi:MAG: porin PorA family protein [Actinomycetota bacterium]
MEEKKGRKRSRAGVVLLVAGLVLLVAAPVWRFAIAPLFIRLPEDLENRSTYEGHFKVFADPQTSRFYPEGQEVTTRIRISNEDLPVPGKCDSEVLVLSERVEITDMDTGKVLEGLRGETTHVLDRRTCENVPGVIEGIDRTGYSVTFPLGAGKRGYPIWDDDLDRSVSCEFVRADTFDGIEHKDLPVYVYHLGGKMEKMAHPPPGLPESVSGKQVKELAGRDLPISDQAEIALEYYKKNDVTFYVEPETGSIVYVPKNHYEYHVKNAPGATPEYLKLAEVEYGRTLEAAREGADKTVKYVRLIDLDKRGIPLGFLLLGAVLSMTGLVLVLRHPGTEPTAG